MANTEVEWRQSLQGDVRTWMSWGEAGAGTKCVGFLSTGRKCIAMKVNMLTQTRVWFEKGAQDRVLGTRNEEITTRKRIQLGNCRAGGRTRTAASWKPRKENRGLGNDPVDFQRMLVSSR